MPTREEIREGLTWLVRHSKPEEGETVGHTLIKYLHSKDVAIKVDGELPKPTLNEEVPMYYTGFDDGQRSLLKDKYTKTVPLIEVRE